MKTLLTGSISYNVEIDKANSLAKLELDSISGDVGQLQYLLPNETLEFYNDTPQCENSGIKKYFLGYKDDDDVLVALEFKIWVEADTDVGIVRSSFDTDDCILFRTDHAGWFEMYVYSGLKHLEDDLYEMMIDGRLDTDMNAMFDQE